MKTLILAATITTLISSANVNAALIDNGNTTLDTNTGLEWLDLNITDDMAASDIYSDVGGYMSIGFRSATSSEIISLWGSAGIISNYEQLNPNDQWYTNNTTEVLAFMGLFGTTGGYSDSYGNTYLYSHGLYQNPVANAYTEATIILLTSATGTQNTSADFAQMDYFISEDPDWMGHYLVRTSTVPVPASIWLFGSGLIGLAGFCRRK